MSLSEVVRHNPAAVGFGTRWGVRAVVVAARLLATRRPARIRRVMELASRGARPAGAAEATRAHTAVTAVSLVCAGREGCLPRSIAVALLCRVRGTWPTWCVGVRRLPPFAAHAWIEAGGEPVGENIPADYFRLFYSVPPVRSAPPAAPTRPGSPRATDAA